MLSDAAGLYSVRRVEADMRVTKNVLKTMALLAWSAVSFGQQQGAPPPEPPPAPRTETPAPPAAEREEATPPPRDGGNADEREFIPTEELAPDAAITFPVNI
jgi:hypothetical protein